MPKQKLFFWRKKRMSKKIYSLMAILMIASLVLVACGTDANNDANNNMADNNEANNNMADNNDEANDNMADDNNAADDDADDDDVVDMVEFKACEVTDTGGVDDKSFNQLAWQGVQEAVEALGIEGTYLESNQQTDYEVNINAFVEEGCDIILPIGFLIADATAAASAAYPDTLFAIVDVDWVTGDNVAGIMFQTDQAAFLAGYVAAASTQTGKVGTYGGIPIPSVTIFMDGFFMGVQYYNQVKGTAVEVVGWDPANPDGGLFTQNFESLEDGRNFAISMMDEGVDIILPVAGPVGLGSAAAAQERGDVWIIGVDADWTLTAPEYADVILTSVLKKVNVGVFNNIATALDGTWVPGTVVYDLEDGAVGLAGIENFSAELQAELADLTAGIIAGDIQTSP
jgi:basic membrane protein A